ncbi:UDP-glucosyltransferase 2-like [Lasioglossum baleicum]|uniref:UDP-glucosyltransferase 2-like n=1 Tax=Lasioglossum baleicum TaxID=434251 RepID=UPI003FCD382C
MIKRQTLSVLSYLLHKIYNFPRRNRSTRNTLIRFVQSNVIVEMSRLSICVLIVAFSSIAAGARILAVFPYPSHSHQVVFRSLSIELAKRGHEMVVFTSYPTKDLVLANYTEIDLSILVRKWKSHADFIDLGTKGVWVFFNALLDYGTVISDTVLSHPRMQSILAANSSEKFDVILMQQLFYDALYAIPARLDVPMVGVLSSHVMFTHLLQYGSELLMPYGIDPVTGYPMQTFWHRFREMYLNLRAVLQYYYKCLPAQDEVMRKHFGDTMPPIEKLADRSEIVLINSHPFLTEPRSIVPGFVHIGGCRFMSQSPKHLTLPEDLKVILDNAKNGFIYFSMGSNVNVKQYTEEMVTTILSVFTELPYTIIWKSEVDIKNKPKNVIIRSWCPQEEILAHPNILLFIFQGGAQSLEEAIEYEVPLLGIPVFGDQHVNVQMLKRRGVAMDLMMHELTKEKFKEAILTVILNPSYKENVRKLRNLLHDLPYHPMENAMWWIEHVIRHKGAKHLRCKSRDMELYKLLHLDIFAALAVFCVLLCSLVLFGVRFVCRITRRLIKRCTGKSLKKD